MTYPIHFHVGNKPRIAFIYLLLAGSLSASPTRWIESSSPGSAQQGQPEMQSAAQPTAPSGNAAGNRASAEIPEERKSLSIKRAILNIPGDQKTIWTAPFHIKGSDLPWLAPFGAATGVLIANDRHIMMVERSNSRAIQLGNNISTAGTIGLAGLPASMYLLGTFNGSERWRETGLLTGEALVNSLIVDEALKTVFGRERPTVTDGQGRFFQQIGNPSFPSDHSMLSWTAASVIAHEYPGWVSQSLAYGAAGAVSVARVAARKHFPSDVVIGAGLGWMIGRQIYRSHHNSELDELDYGEFFPERPRFTGPQTGASYVPMDSWVYPAFDRLVAAGYIRDAEQGLRPWSRSECARLTAEARVTVDLDQQSADSEIVKALAAEFAPELEGKETGPRLYLEEIYSRVGFIAGRPLADDYHFAKTITYDFGRPFGQGVNAVTGFSTRSTIGPLAFYVRGEYQHASGLPGEGAPAQQAIASLEGLPFAPPQRTGSFDRLTLLDTYVSLNFRNNVLSFGKQTLWWGPGEDGPFLASNNAEPLPMLRFSRATPFTLPWLLKLMGPIRFEIFVAQLEGQQFVAITDSAGNPTVVGPPLDPHPYLQGTKFSFKPTRNLEFGFGETAIFSGPGFPFTFHSLLRTYSAGNTAPGARSDPGDRRSAFDFSYRLPGLRDRLTLYGDSFTEDEFSPITFPRKSSFRTGLYAPQLPSVPRADLRVEGTYTDIPSINFIGVAYSNAHYLSGYTNYGQIIGNAIGREGRGVNVWTTYRFTALNTLQLHYRTQHVNPEFLKGGYLRDYDATGTLAAMGNLVLSATVKYEHWNFPLLSTAPRSNVSAALQLSFRPAHGLFLQAR